LPDRFETKVLTNLNDTRAEYLYTGLLTAGFRRSQTIAYKPICQNCSACQSIRIVVSDFKPSKTHKRILNRNENLYRKIVPPYLKYAHYDLYQAYIQKRHAGEEMANMLFDDIKAMVEQTTIDTVIVEYYHKQTQELYGWVITDLTPYGPSMVYSVFNPKYEKNSLGTYAILNHIDLSISLGMPYLFLGYWIKECQKMAYKINFTPYELHIKTEWVRFDK
jgi:arginine-tRNA-protein transferase